MNKKEIIKHAKQLLKSCIIIDTETTGLYETDTVIELAAINESGEVLYDDVIRPLSPVSAAAQAVHGIDYYYALVHGDDIEKACINALGHVKNPEAPITSFNLVFDRRMVANSLRTNKLQALRDDFLMRTRTNENCIMFLANSYFADHLKWDFDNSKFSRLSLEACLKLAGIEREGTAHRALSDAKAALHLLQFIAGARK